MVVVPDRRPLHPPLRVPSSVSSPDVDERSLLAGSRERWGHGVERAGDEAAAVPAPPRRGAGRERRVLTVLDRERGPDQAWPPRRGAARVPGAQPGAHCGRADHPVGPVEKSDRAVTEISGWATKSCPRG